MDAHPLPRPALSPPSGPSSAVGLVRLQSDRLSDAVQEGVGALAGLLRIHLVL